MSAAPESVPVVTIDGPSASGKGTVSRLLAQRLGWHMLDSGALYRLVALAARSRHISLDDEAALAAVAINLDVKFIVNHGINEVSVYLEGTDVTRDLRRETAGDDASRVAVLPAVRQGLLARQRAFRLAPGLVADGRDMGTVVFPEAPLKIFLTASAEERARRRYNQLKEKGIPATMSALLDEISARDERDTQRATAPLKPAVDAIVIDTSALGITDVVERLLSLCNERFGQKG